MRLTGTRAPRRCATTRRTAPPDPTQPVQPSSTPSALSRATTFAETEARTTRFVEKTTRSSETGHDQSAPYVAGPTSVRPRFHAGPCAGCCRRPTWGTAAMNSTRHTFSYGETRVGDDSMPAASPIRGRLPVDEGFGRLLRPPRRGRRSRPRPRSADGRRQCLEPGRGNPTTLVPDEHLETVDEVTRAECVQVGRWGRPGRHHQARSNRSRFITLSHAATKSFTNFSFASSPA